MSISPTLEAQDSRVVFISRSFINYLRGTGRKLIYYYSDGYISTSLGILSGNISNISLSEAKNWPYLSILDRINIFRYHDYGILQLEKMYINKIVDDLEHGNFSRIIVN